MRSYSDGTHTVAVDRNRVTVSVANAQLTVPIEFFMESSNMVQQQFYSENHHLRMNVAVNQAPLSSGPGESPESSPTTTPSSE